MNGQRQRVPLGFVVLSALAALFMAAGAVGLLAPQTAPLLARPEVAWSLVGSGVVMDGFAIASLLAARRTSRR